MPSPFISVICFRTKEANKQRKKTPDLRLLQNIHLAISKLYRYNSDYVATWLRGYAATQLTLTLTLTPTLTLTTTLALTLTATQTRTPGVCGYVATV